MLIHDRVYGDCHINEPILIELIQSKPLQRLKGINQAGIAQYVLPKKDITRYEHCVGVMILLQRLGTSLEEQIAGLLHDVPHTAFSHVIDFVFASETHDYHEKFLEKVVMNSEIPEIIARHGLSLSTILDEHNFPLLERAIPDLCADRVDYSLRDMLAYVGHQEQVATYLQHLINYHNEIIFDDQDAAVAFANDYLMMNESCWANPKEVAMCQVMADALKLALDNGLLTETDLFTDDATVYSKLQASQHPKILQILTKLTPGFDIHLNPNDYDFFTKTKLRFIDPKFIDNDNTLMRVTDINPAYEKALSIHHQKMNTGFHIKVLS